jgi:ribosomal protein S18 acetylase RimI-like enzyme
MASTPGFEVVEYSGSPAELASFVSKCWDGQFPDNVTCPQWDAEYFAWAVFGNPDNMLLAAYDDGELVGFIFGEALGFRCGDRVVPGVFSSFLSADPARKGQGVAKTIASELFRRVQEEGYAFDVGFEVPTPGSLGPKFWLGSQKGERANGIRPWIRPLDARRLARVSAARYERAAARVAGLARLDRVPARTIPHLRPFEPRDLDACLDLVRTKESASDFCFDWTAERLLLQLDHEGFPTTFVYDDGQVRGLTNFHPIRFRGRERFVAGQIDHLVAECGDRRIERHLLDATLQSMKQDGQALVVCPSSAGMSTVTRLRSGFLPMPSPYRLLFAFVAPDLDVTRLRRPMLHLR